MDNFIEILIVISAEIDFTENCYFSVHVSPVRWAIILNYFRTRKSKSNCQIRNGYCLAKNCKNPFVYQLSGLINNIIKKQGVTHLADWRGKAKTR